MHGEYEEGTRTGIPPGLELLTLVIGCLKLFKKFTRVPRVPHGVGFEVDDCPFALLNIGGQPAKTIVYLKLQKALMNPAFQAFTLQG
jgi:hypothetical protein